MGKTLGSARLQGIIPWDAIEDRTRTVNVGDSEEVSPLAHVRWRYLSLRDAAEFYGMPRWWGQPIRVQLWLEKQALSSVFERLAHKLSVDLMVMKGFASLSQLFKNSDILRETSEVSMKRIVILQFGDFDPSGECIQDSAARRIKDDFGVHIECRRIALTKVQVVRYQLPPDFTKIGDTRRKRFIEKHGVDWAVELDALNPDELSRLVHESVNYYWEKTAERNRDTELDSRQTKIRQLVSGALNPDFRISNEGEGKNGQT
jgi:hypothetical protein